MSDLIIQPEELHKSALAFRKASKETLTILKKLDATTSDLENKWSGVTQQTFYKQYRELHQYMEGFAAIMTNVAQEMQAMADRFEKADR